MSLHIFHDKSAVIKALAERIEDIAMMSIYSKGCFNFVLSGGNTPKQLYETLAAPPFSESIPWSKVYFFLGDERYVPLTDEESNYKMVQETLLQPLDIPEERIFRYDTTQPPEDAAIKYYLDIRQYFNFQKAAFDLILLGLGDNVHTASLFPNTDVLSDRAPGIKSVLIKGSNSYRLTMNAPLINQSHHIAFLVTGQSKAMAVHQVVAGKLDRTLFPAQLIRTELTDWYIDEAAAAYL
jgi:6-phosphogluconolactonase